MPTAQYAFFRNAEAAIADGLNWLERHADVFDAERPGYAEFHLVCALEHLSHYQLRPGQQPRLDSIVAQVSALDRVFRSSPKHLARVHALTARKSER